MVCDKPNKNDICNEFTFNLTQIQFTQASELFQCKKSENGDAEGTAA